MKLKSYFTVIYVIFIINLVNSSPCSRLESLNITSGTVYANGSIIYEGLEFYSTVWYEVEEEGMMVRYGCPCIGRTCLWKCCPRGQVYHGRNCVDTNLTEANPFSPGVYSGSTLTTVAAHEHFFYMHNELCEDRYLVDSSSSQEEIYIQKNGSLYEIAAGRPQWHLPTAFCVDLMVDNFTETPRMVAAVCYPDEDVNDDSSVLYATYAIGLLLSVPFLLATFLVYAFIPDLRNLHGMCLMAYCAGLIVAYPFLAYLKLHVGKIGVALSGCLVIAFIVYYAFQTSFFWLNVMCFDIWRTFRTGSIGSQQSQCGYRGGSSSKRRERRRFMYYGLYAWGVPLLLTMATAAMQFGNPSDGFIKPGLGDRKCWFDDWISELVYFFTPVLALVVCNVVLFSVTAHRIRSIKQETAILKGAESSRSDKLKKDKQRYALYLKLFMVMGVNWTVELISFAVGGSNWYWIVIDISNIVLGFVIFMIFVWKKKVRNLAVKRWRSLFGMRPAADSAIRSYGSSTAPTEDTRISHDDSAMRLKDMH